MEEIEYGNFTEREYPYKLMGLGGSGPVLSMIAYCLPNYEDIRSEIGSKQIMYTFPQSSNTSRYFQIYLSKSEREFFETYSPDMKLESMMGSLCTLLHETIGHGSGANIEGITNEIKSEQVGEWTNGLEEMRAEILALYVGTHFLSEIADSGIIGNWGDIVSHKNLLELQVKHIAGGALNRWRITPADHMEVKQAHALADTGIMYYLIDHSDGALELVTDTSHVDGLDLPVLRLVIHDIYKLLPVIEELAITVQKMSSTAVFEEINQFMTTYATSTRDRRWSNIIKKMRDVYSQGITSQIQIFPEWEDTNGQITLCIPSDPIASTLKIWTLANQ